ncbi:hypothetical protein Glove_529g27 [Diversispora epigaea]|uniref:Uncharacterized protein n=1 Tax=Diversispora epigaea TaxID=1348612 RepID=A0A397GH32_9GLOM|nr:hypothetical protein Glove_529g27 [Diversispora epigaea]
MADAQFRIDLSSERISKLEDVDDDLLARIKKLEDADNDLKIAMEILNEEPIIEYRPPFLNGLELDAFFRHHRIRLEVQGSQHRLHSTSWYKDIEDVVWYDEKPEMVIPERIQKIKNFINQAFKVFDL